MVYGLEEIGRFKTNKNNLRDELIYPFYNNFLNNSIVIYKNNNKQSELEYVNSTSIDLLRKIKIRSKEDTLDLLISEEKCISRFGDGEFNMLFGNSIGFQNFNSTLIESLQKIFNSNNNQILIGINDFINPNNHHKLNEKAKSFWNDWIENRSLQLLRAIDFNKIYYSACISRFYIDYANKTRISDYVKKLKQLWEKRDILIIEGERSRLGVGNDLFSNSKSIQRILCPMENAFNIYDKILQETLKFLKYSSNQQDIYLHKIKSNQCNKNKFEISEKYCINENITLKKKKLILIALGPTATILSYDLCKAGYQAIDIGHVDIEYEWYLREVNHKVPIKNKYVYEVIGGDINIDDDIQDFHYFQQIVEIIH